MTDPASDLADRLVRLLTTLTAVSPAVAENAPITWVPGIDNPAVKVSDEAVELQVVCHDWPVHEILARLQEQVADLAGGRRVLVCCLDVASPEPAASGHTEAERLPEPEGEAG